MPIPETEEFEHCLGGLTLEKPSADDDYDRIEAVPSRTLLDDAGSHPSEPLWCWHRNSFPISLEALIRRVCKELHHNNHLATSEIAKVLLGFVCLATRTKSSRVARLNSLLSAIGNAEASQFLIGPFPPHPETTDLQVGRFLVGHLKLDRLMYRCKKVKCDFFERYPKRFVNRFAIEGSPVSLQLLDWPAVRHTFATATNNSVAALVDYYFELLSQHQLESFRYEFREAQEVFVAAGAPYIDVDNYLAWHGGSFVAIYENIGSRNEGYFCPLFTGARVDVARVDRRFREKSEQLKSEFSFTALGKSEIHKTIGTFCRFLVRAKGHANSGRIDEAFLHNIIALDLLFGEKDASTQTITTRTAIIAATPLGKTYSDMVKHLQILYEKRSRYVHRGLGIGNGDLDHVQPIVLVVLQCPLRLQSAQSNRKDGFVSEWLKVLDYLAAAAKAGRVIDDHELRDAGIATRNTSPGGDD